MKKTVFFGLLVIGLAFSFIGCDNNPNGDDFTSSTNETISNDINTLGLVGTIVSSNNENIATAVILSDKIKITSVGNGSAVITVSEGTKKAAINVAITKTGSITIGLIQKYNPFMGSWFSTVGSGVTLICEYSTWEIKIDSFGMKGNYVFSDIPAPFTITHIKDINFNWTDQVPADTEAFKPSEFYGLTSLPQTFTGIVSGTQLITTSGAGTFNLVP